MKFPHRISLLDCCLAVALLAIGIFVVTAQCSALANWGALVAKERAIFQTHSREFVPTINPNPQPEPK